ncbi:hypothetical protein ASE63_04525 [Bosea sp. Root381]|uniref:AprI/Inh family metalloprotease inhibitor n=1 Tax=Bosea sp. Root381 TaxID=1736524 RepID=UPI0006F8F6D1|nr:AprI/Inh family metalloprotease inhibitor [Bosea sp. Root381]KRE09792.1 hypothetical protein ASE63_04525 [Bosea sp. Root381]
MRIAAPAVLPLLTAGLLASATALHAQTAPPPRGVERAPDAVRPLLGAWDLEQPGASRACTVTFSVEPAVTGHRLRFPATCRRALPILNDAMDWGTGPNGRPRLFDPRGQVVIDFRDGTAERGFTGTGTDGKAYELNAKNHPRAARRPVQSPAELAATAAQRRTAVDPALAPAAETLPGRYAMMRQSGREACLLMLGASAAGNAPARFEGSCQDTGLTIFDPVGWRYAAGRLALVARRGHSIELVFEDGQWRKDPAVGAPLLLRKLAD